jgi:hypothetical protein
MEPGPRTAAQGFAKFRSRAITEAGEHSTVVCRLEAGGPLCRYPPRASPLAPHAAHTPVSATVKWPHATHGSDR